MKRATAYIRKGKVFLHPLSKTTHGLWIYSEPVEITSLDKNDIELTEILSSILSKSKVGVSHPESWSSLFDPVLVSAEVKTWKTFIKFAKCVELELKNDLLDFISTTNLGAKDGFAPKDNSPLIARISDPRSVGSALKKAFELSE